MATRRIAVICLIVALLLLLAVSTALASAPLWRGKGGERWPVRVGNEDHSAPVFTAVPDGVPMCPIEWCPNPPVGEKCHCPIAYTLIAPGVNSR